MGRTLLIGAPGATWREWLSERLDSSDLLCLDPASHVQDPPGRLCLIRGGKAVAWRFYGSFDSQRAPHVWIGAMVTLLEQASAECVVQLPPYRATPLMRQCALLAAQLLKPDAILVSSGIQLDLGGFPVGPEEVTLPADFPDIVKTAQRRSHLSKFLDSCERHEILIRSTTWEGSRLGSGSSISPEVAMKAGLAKAHHLEACGGTLLLVTDDTPEERVASRLMDLTHCRRVVASKPSDYEGLLCSFARASGEDFGMGMIERMDFGAGVATILNKATRGAPVRLVRLGAARIDKTGNELGEQRAWQV